MKQDTHRYGMFGVFRYFLAVMVLVAHLTPIRHSYAGHYAVFGFFTLSGYLMSLTLHEFYFHKQNGIIKYYINRFLRIYPLYAVVALFAALFTLYFQQIAHQIGGRFTFPQTAEDWFYNMSIVGIADLSGVVRQAVLIPPTWSLGIEIIFWVLLPFLVRSKITLSIWTLCSLAWIAFLLLDGAGYQYYLASATGASIAFCIGSWLYFIRQQFAHFSHKILLGLLVLLVTYYIACPYFVKVPSMEGLYGAMVLNGFVLYGLSKIDRAKVPQGFLKADKLLGNLAYPIFLVHIVVAGVLKATILADVTPRTWLFFLLSFPAVNLAAYFLWIAVDHPVEIIRRNLKARKSLGLLVN